MADTEGLLNLVAESGQQERRKLGVLHVNVWTRFLRRICRVDIKANSLTH